MKRIVLIFCASLMLAGVVQGAPIARAMPEGNRFLFLVDIGSSMRRTDPANRQALFDLVYSGLNGKMQPGDTFGLWTYNNKVYAGEFPMQVWAPEANLELGSLAATFLKGKRYSGESDTFTMLSAVTALARTVQDVNVLVLCDGQTPFRGCSLDPGINSAFQKRMAERRKAEKPFIVSLVVRKGEMVSSAVLLPGEAIELPLPLPKPRTNMLAQPGTATSNSTPQPQVIGQRDLDAETEALFLGDRKPGSALIMKGPQSARTSVATTTKIETASGPALTNNPPATVTQPTTPLPNTEVAEPSSAKPEPVAIVKPVMTPGNLSSNALSSTTAHEQSTLSSEEKQAQPLGPKESPTLPSPATNTVAAQAQPAPVIPNNATPTAATPVPAPTSESAPALGPSTPVVATAIPKPLFNPQWLIISGAALLMTAVMLMLMVFRRVRRLAEPSVITRSMEQKSLE